MPSMRTFKGDSFTIGLQQGLLYKQNGMNLNGVVIETGLYKKQKEIYAKFYPEQLEEIEGVAKGGGFDIDKCIYSFIKGEIRFYKKRVSPSACTIFGIKNGKGFFVGRNYDWIPAAHSSFQAYKVIPKGRKSFIGVTDMGITAPTDGPGDYRFLPEDTINDHGLYIGLTFATTNQWSYGISSLLMLKYVAERCKSVTDALNLFKKTPVCCPKNFFIADKKGNMAVVEHTSKEYRVILPQNNMLIKTNHYLSPDLASKDTVLTRSPGHNTFLRYYEILQALNLYESSFTHPKVKTLLRKTGSHVFEREKGNNTIWTLSMNMEEQIYHLYSGQKSNRRAILKF